jgi:hypothetical protein
MRTYSEQQLFALKTICGGIFYALSKHTKLESLEYHRGHLCSSLGIEQATIYCIEEVTSTGFLLTSRCLCFRYHHDVWSHSGRIIEFILSASGR